MKSTLLISSLFLALSIACNHSRVIKSNETAKVDEGLAVNSSVTDKNTIEINKDNTEKNAGQKAIDNFKSDYFALINATSQKWTAGTPQGGSGTEYYFKVKINTAENIKFDSAWINDKRFEVFLAKESNSISSGPIKFEKGDNITLRISDLKNQRVKTENIMPPLKYEGAALIGYTINAKRQYFIVKEIENQTSPNRP